ncbi:MAG: hypothetical protein Q8N88_03625 [Nanoarchaeota archaeon]|nr:hypothetical protein [Nanoarchaeota archaeon]
MRIKIEDVVLWIVILMIIGIGIYLLIVTNSPIEVDSLISLTLFVAASELLIWRYLFLMDKKASIAFVKIKEKLNNIEKNNSRILERL